MQQETLSPNIKKINETIITLTMALDVMRNRVARSLTAFILVSRSAGWLSAATETASASAKDR